MLTLSEDRVSGCGSAVIRQVVQSAGEMKTRSHIAVFFCQPVECLNGRRCRFDNKLNVAILQAVYNLLADFHDTELAAADYQIIRFCLQYIPYVINLDTVPGLSRPVRNHSAIDNLNIGRVAFTGYHYGAKTILFNHDQILKIEQRNKFMIALTLYQAIGHFHR